MNGFQRKRCTPPAPASTGVSGPGAEWARPFIRHCELVGGRPMVATLTFVERKTSALAQSVPRGVEKRPLFVFAGS